MDVREKLVKLKKVLRECLHFNYDEFSCEMSLDIDITAKKLIENGVTVQFEDQMPSNAERIRAIEERIRAIEERIRAINGGAMKEYIEKEEGRCRSDIKAEAIKEFAERLCEDRVSNDPVVIAVKAELKEMERERE